MCITGKQEIMKMAYRIGVLDECQASIDVAADQRGIGLRRMQSDWRLPHPSHELCRRHRPNQSRQERLRVQKAIADA
jgi:hypothetical protein